MSAVKNKRPYTDSIGEKLYRMLVKSVFKKNGFTYARCLCDCGRTKTVLLSHLRRGNLKSCGCYNLEDKRRQLTTHGLSKHPLYKIWKGMRARCNNMNVPAYKHYGGRGIRVCKLWGTNFKPFYDWAIKNGWKKGLDIDRRNNNRGYKPSNCRFVTKVVNSKNTRRNVWIKYGGKNMVISDWARHLGVTYSSLRRRLNKKWPMSKVLSKEKFNYAAKSHGLYKHPLYKKWERIKGWCYNKNGKEYKNYGAIGIVVYDKWQNDFKKFYDWAIRKGWGIGKKIKRISSKGDFVPNNLFLN